jgi:glycosyltransferase involved in cell wall biosynthesis
MTALEVPVPAPSLRTLQIGMTSTESGGGGERYYFGLLNALPTAGVASIGLVSGDAAQLSMKIGVTSFAPAETSLIKRWIALRRHVAGAAANSDVIVSHFAPYALPVLDTLGSQPSVIHFHGPWALESAAEGAGRSAVITKHLIERVVYSRASRFIVLSASFASILERRYGVPADSIRIVPGGVNLEKFTRVTSKREAKVLLGWPTDRPTVLSVRRLVHAKGLENLIDAVVESRRSIPDILVIIAGSGPLERELKRRTHDLELDPWVRFAGFVPDAQLPTMYRAADLFVVPTVALEGFGLVVIEALACGTPALVTPIAGLPEVVKELDPGLILDGAAAADIARGVCAALSGQHAIPSEDACAAYAERFDWINIAGRVAEVYHEVA